MPTRDCQGCRHQREWGCEARRWRTPPEGEEDGPENWVDPAHLPLTLLSQNIWSCPRQHIRENPAFWATVLKFYGMYKRGFLPDRGAVVDQSNRTIELFRVLDQANDLCDQEEEKKRQIQRNRQNRGSRHAK